MVRGTNDCGNVRHSMVSRQLDLEALSPKGVDRSQSPELIKLSRLTVKRKEEEDLFQRGDMDSFIGGFLFREDFTS